VPQTATFGRRQPKAAPRAPAPARPLRTGPAPPELSAAAEAFRAGLAAERKSPANEFAAWRRSRGWRRLLIYAATAVSFAPGIASFVMDAPLPVSIGLEVAAIAANVWVRRERARRRREILAWESPAET